MNNLLQNNDFNNVFSILDSDKIDKINDKTIKRLLYKYQNEKKIIKIYEKVFNKFKEDEAFLTIGMRIYLNVNDVDSAYKLLKLIKLPKKRNVLPIFKYYCILKDELVFSFYKNNMYDKFLIDEEDYLCLTKLYYNDKEKMEFIFNDMKTNILRISNEITNILLNNTSKIVDINNNKCPHCLNNLISFDLTKQEKNNLISNIENFYFTNKKYLNKYKSFLQNNNINIFIDAGNIIYYQGGKINYNSFKKIDIIVKNLEKNNNVLVIIHQRHLQNIKKMNNKEQILKLYNSWKVFETPFKLNDDWYFIYGSLLIKNSFIVTNDKLRDHQFKISEKTNLNNTLAKLIDRIVIRYDFKEKKYNDNNLILKYPNKYSTEIQKVNNIWHFPIYNNNKWLCYQ